MLSSVIFCIVRRAPRWGGRYTRTWVCGVWCAMSACSDLLCYGQSDMTFYDTGPRPLFLTPICCGTDVGRVTTFCLPSPMAGAGYDMTYDFVHTLSVLKICIWHSGFSTQFSESVMIYTSVILLYIFSTYFVLTPFLRGLRFYAAQVQTTDLPIRTSRILLLLFWALFFRRAHPFGTV